MVDCVRNGDIEGGRAIQLKVNRIRSTFSACKATPAAVLKELANLRGLAGGHPRAPITTLSDQDRRMVLEMSAEVGLKKV